METTKTIIIEKRAKHDSDFEKISWVLKARSTDAIRRNINSVKIDGGLMVCTDGHRLHLYMTDREIEDGLYEIVTATRKQIVLKELDADFPAYERVIPRPAFTHKTVCNGDHAPLFHAVYKNFADDNRSYNTDYLHDAYMDHAEISLQSDPGLKPLVIFDNDSRAAVVMPLDWTKRH